MIQTIFTGFSANLKELFHMASGFKVFAALGAIAAGAAAIFALKKRKELEDYDYEELDDDFDDCCDDCCDCAEDIADKVEDAVDEVADGVEETLDKIEDEVDEIDK